MATATEKTSADQGPKGPHPDLMANCSAARMSLAATARSARQRGCEEGADKLLDAIAAIRMAERRIARGE